ncbi:MAG TPA: hypothetical protein VNO52_07855 [Methylomirabilota bacterium]|nr:hypothetical protein [Methylomirabilota bacterium]
MGFAEFPAQRDSVALLQRSLERGRLGHAYLLRGPEQHELEGVARALAQTLSCESPPRRGATGLPLDACGACRSCRQVAGETHPDVLWVRPESKSRIIAVEQIRDLMQTIYLTPTQARYKVGILVGADRLNASSANAFLKTLEEPPADSILILLSTEPERLLETIVSRCLRLSLAGEAPHERDPEVMAWLDRFATIASAESRSLLGRYSLLGLLLEELARMKERVESERRARSPLERHEDIEPKLRERWEEELEAAVEADYRRRRAGFLAALEGWLRDVWLHTLNLGEDLLTYPALRNRTTLVARRISPDAAMENINLLEQLQRLLAGNVQEALALEVSLLQLKL